LSIYLDKFDCIDKEVITRLFSYQVLGW